MEEELRKKKRIRGMLKLRFQLVKRVQQEIDVELKQEWLEKLRVLSQSVKDELQLQQRPRGDEPSGRGGLD